MPLNIKDVKTPRQAIEWVREVFDVELFMNHEHDYQQALAFDHLLSQTIKGFPPDKELTNG